MDPVAENIRAGIETRVVALAPYIAAGIIAFFAVVFRDIFDAVISAIFFAIGSDMGRGKSLLWRGRKGIITKIGVIRTNMRMGDNGLIQRIPNQMLRKEPYEIMPYHDDFCEEDRVNYPAASWRGIAVPRG